MPIRNQASLGESIREMRKDQNMNGMLLFGKVIKVYPKNHSADVKILNNQHGNLLTSSKNEGKYSCRILESYAGVDPKLGVAYGSTTPIQSGCYVVVGFINNYKSQPVILGCLHDSSVSNILSENNSESEIYRKTVITRLQDYYTMNRDGEFDLYHHSGAYIVSRNSDINEFDFDEDDLQLSNKAKYLKSSHALDVLAGLKTFSGFIKIVVKSVSGVIRLIKSNKNSLSLIEFDSNGSFKLRLQVDSNKKNSGNKYSEVNVDINTGDIELKQNLNGKSNNIVMKGNKGISISSDFNISITNSKDISVSSSETINISAHDINITSWGEQDN